MHVLVAQQLPNMDFENWSYTPLAKDYITLDGPWTTFNSCEPVYPNGATQPDTICKIYAKRDQDAYSGNYSIKIQTPAALVGTGGFTTWDGNSQLVPFRFKPNIFSGYYKFFKGKETDEATISVDFFDESANTTVYGAKSIFKTTIETWTKFSVELYEIFPIVTPEYVQVIINHAFNESGNPSPNTYLMLDKLAFEYPTADILDDLIKEGLTLQDGIIDVSTMHGVEALSVYNMNGVKTATINKSFDTHQLSNGIYVVSVLQNNVIRNFKLSVNN